MQNKIDQVPEEFKQLADDFSKNGFIQGGDYTPMLQEVVQFFRTGEAPVPLEETIEIYAFMEAADVSKRRGGAPVSIDEILNKNGW